MFGFAGSEKNSWSAVSSGSVSGRLGSRGERSMRTARTLNELLNVGDCQRRALGRIDIACEQELRMISGQPEKAARRELVATHVQGWTVHPANTISDVYIEKLRCKEGQRSLGGTGSSETDGSRWRRIRLRDERPFNDGWRVTRRAAERRSQLQRRRAARVDRTTHLHTVVAEGEVMTIASTAPATTASAARVRASILVSVHSAEQAPHGN